MKRTSMRHIAGAGPAVLATVLMLAPAAPGNAVAAPVLYQFSTQAGPLPGASAPAASFGGTDTVSGTFLYDAQSPATGTSNGYTIYGTLPPPSPLYVSFGSLSASVGAFSFADTRGSITVGNEVFTLTDYSVVPPASRQVDFLQIIAEPPPGGPARTYNFSGFDIGGFTLTNVRMFWIEGQQTPGLVPDFLGDHGLPATLPDFQGMLALDFAPAGSPAGTVTSSLFFGGLQVAPIPAVPEPGTFALLAGGLGLMGLILRRRAAPRP